MKNSGKILNRWEVWRSQRPLTWIDSCVPLQPIPTRYDTSRVFIWGTGLAVLCYLICNITGNAGTAIFLVGILLDSAVHVLQPEVTKRPFYQWFCGVFLAIIYYGNLSPFCCRWLYSCSILLHFYVSGHHYGGHINCNEYKQWKKVNHK